MFLWLGVSYAQMPQDEQIRRGFVSGRIEACSLLKTHSGELWLVIGVHAIEGWALVRKSSSAHLQLHFNESKDFEEVAEVVRYGSGDEPWYCVN
ncbi:MAG: hypothetical protein AAB449_01265 [Patescibacteria group bacterium]